MAEAATTITVSQREANYAGARYEGEVSIATGRREGEGTFYYPNPYFSYDGQWVDGQKQGQGRLSFGDGGFYEGNFEQGEIMGDGRQVWADGANYHGQFVEGARHGRGILEKADGARYEGAWERSKYWGEGELSQSNGDRYSGSFVAHRFHGQGTFVQPAKSRSYVGAFENGLFEGEGELTERDGVFEYKGQFRTGMMDGTGRGTDTRSGIVYMGNFEDNNPALAGAAWDIGTTGEQQESYMLAAELLREEAMNQVNSATVDPKAKGKDKKPEPKKGAAAAPPPDEDEKPTGPELQLTAGLAIPEVALRLTTSDRTPIRCESGRRFRLTMYKERKDPGAADPQEAEILRRPIRFGDMRPTFVDPLDEGSAAPSGKASPAPPPPGEEGVEPPEPPSIGEEAMEGSIGPEGEVVIGGSDEWLLPMHLVAAIYFLRVEDVTEGIEADSIFVKFSPLEIPVKVAVRPESK